MTNDFLYQLVESRAKVLAEQAGADMDDLNIWGRAMKEAAAEAGEMLNFYE